MPVKEERRGTAVVVGASLSGLMTALALSRAGLSVTMLERWTADPGKGAAVGVDEAELERITGVARTGIAVAQSSPGSDVLAWSDVHARLRRAVDANAHVALH